MHFRLARPEDAARVAGILSAAAANLRERGEELWSIEDVSEHAVSPESGFVREARLERYTVNPNISSEPRPCFMYARCR